MTAWTVYRPCSSGKVYVEKDEEIVRCREIDTVFYDDVCDEDYVRRGLVDHDGYPDDIIVVGEAS